jgi:3-dehydroquinate dehydratase/shikimate dehydrogenase
MAKICLCLTAKTLKRDLEILEKYRKYIDVAELRVDYLDPDERFLIRSFPEMAGLPVLLTVRRRIDGGKFEGGEGARIVIMSKGLAFAEADRRRNFAYVDIEEDLNVPSLEEAARTFGTRIIRSFHNLKGVNDNLVQKLRGLRRVGDELVKAAVMPQNLDDVIKVYKAAKETSDLSKILLCMGDYGGSTRILAEYMGSQFSYTTVKGESDIPLGAAGQFDPRELTELYRFRDLTPKTKIFGVVGYPLKVTSSPEFFNSIFKIENSDAVYVPFPADSISSFMRLAEEMGLRGVSVTVPYKEAVLPYLFFKSDTVKAVDACNTIVPSDQGWLGYNTDARGFSGSLLDFIGKKNFKGQKITIIGAGGAARAVVSEVARLKGKALILNRTNLKARELAGPYHFAWGGLDGQGIDLMERYRDIIINTTSAGMEGEAVDTDPVDLYRFSGREVAMDLIYKPEKTHFLLRAEEAGCRILNGYDMLLRQARLQYGYYMGKEFPASLMNRVKF